MMSVRHSVETVRIVKEGREGTLPNGRGATYICGSWLKQFFLSGGQIETVGCGALTPTPGTTDATNWAGPTAHAGVPSVPR